MSVTRLAQIWEASPDDLRSVLASQGYDLTDNLNWDRALVSLISYNAGILDKADDVSAWVAHPRFAETMASIPDGTNAWKIGLQTLQESFARKLLVLYGSIDTAWTTTGDGYGDAIGGYDAQDVIDAARHAAGTAAVGAAWNAASHAVGYAVLNVMRDISWTDDAFGPTASAAAARVVGATPQTVATVAWRTVIGFDGQFRDKIASIPVEQTDFDPSALVTSLLEVDLTSMVQVAKCFWLYSLWELLQDMPPNSVLSTQLDTLIAQHGCLDVFAGVPIVIDRGLSPLLGGIGERGGREDLADLIGEYVARPPTREEVMQRLLLL